MSKFANLRDAYRQPGFVPESRVFVDDGDTDTFVLPLRRRRKKTPVESADGTCPVIMIASFAGAATSTAVVEKSSSNSSSVASIVPGVA
jgi:hypothetical protein